MLIWLSCSFSLESEKFLNWEDIEFLVFHLIYSTRCSSLMLLLGIRDFLRLVFLHAAEVISCIKRE